MSAARVLPCLFISFTCVAGEAPSGTQTLGRIAVVAESIEESASGPVDGYAAKRSSTATRTDTPLNEVPQSISVIGAEQIRDQNSATMQEVVRYSAGVRSEMYGLDNRGDWFTLRGGSEGSTLLNGLRVPLSGWYGVVRNEPFAFERIEVLRGPVSVIAGQNGPGGVVNLVSRRPQDQATGQAELQFGNHSHRQLAADLGGPLNETGTLDFRLVALRKDSDTQVHYAYEQRSYAAPSLRWRPADGTALTLYAEYQKDRSGNQNAFLGYEGTLLPAPHGPISPSLFIGEPDWDRYGGERRRFGYEFSQQLDARWTLRHNLRHDRIEGGMRTMYADWGSGFVDASGAPDPNGTYLNRFWYATDNRARITNADLLLEGHLQAGGVQHTVLFGADTMKNNDDQYIYADGLATPLDVYNPVYGTFADPTIGQSPHSADHIRLRNTSLLLQDQIKIANRYVVVAGLRRDRAESEGVPTESATSKNLGFVWLADGGWSPYVSYSESFEPVAGTAANGEAFRPKRGRQVEGGVKWSPAGDALNITGSIYRLREKNRLAPDPVNVNFSVQRGEVTVEGAELELAGQLHDWQLIGSVSYTDARVTRTTLDELQYLDAQLAGIARQSAALWAVRNFAAWGQPALRAGLGVRYVGRTWDGTDTVSVPAYTLLDAMLAWQLERWALTLNVNNVTDKTYLATCLERGDCWFGSKRRVVAALRYQW